MSATTISEGIWTSGSLAECSRGPHKVKGQLWTKTLLSDEYQRLSIGLNGFFTARNRHVYTNSMANENGQPSAVHKLLFRLPHYHVLRRYISLRAPAVRVPRVYPKSPKRTKAFSLWTDRWYTVSLYLDSVWWFLSLPGNRIGIHAHLQFRWIFKAYFPRFTFGVVLELDSRNLTLSRYSWRKVCASRSRMRAYGGRTGHMMVN